MKDLPFSNNWNNKLDCAYFTTLRRSGQYQVGEWVNVMLGVRAKGPAMIVAKKALTIGDIRKNPFIAGLDTGYPPEECVNIILTMYKRENLTDSDNMYLYLCRYETKKEKEMRAQQEESKQLELI